MLTDVRFCRYLDVEGLRFGSSEELESPIRSADTTKAYLWQLYVWTGGLVLLEVQLSLG